MNETDDDGEGDSPRHGTEASGGVEEVASGVPGPEEPGLLGEDDRIPEPVEPGSPTLENAVFVALGVASMIALVVHLFSLL